MLKIIAFDTHPPHLIGDFPHHHFSMVDPPLYKEDSHYNPFKKAKRSTKILHGEIFDNQVPLQQCTVANMTEKCLLRLS